MNQRKAGIILSYINLGLNSLVMLLYVPMLLHYIPKGQYGIYQMVGSFISVLALFDFGLGSTVVRFVARENALAHTDRSRQVVQTASFLYLCFTVCGLLVGGGIYFLLDPVYGTTLSPTDLKLAQQIFLVLLLNFAVSVPANLWGALLQAHERFVYMQVLYLIGVIISPLLIWGALVKSPQVLNVVWIQTIVNLIIFGSWYVYDKIHLKADFIPHMTNGRLLKRLFGFSLFIFIGNIAGQVYSRLGPLVLGFLVGAVAVANYYIAAQICFAFVMISSLINSVFLPKLSGVWAKSSSMEEHNDIFCKTGRLQAFVAFLLFIGFIFLGKPFLVLWLGPGNEGCYLLAIVLMAGYLLDVLQSVGPTVLQAVDKYRFYAYLYVGTAILNVLLAFFLTRLYGTMGCALSLSFCLLIVKGVIASYYYQKIGLKMVNFFQGIFPILVSSVVVSALLYILWILWPVSALWGSFILHGTVLVGIYSILMFVFVLNGFEKELLLEIYNSFFHFIDNKKKGIEEIM